MNIPLVVITRNWEETIGKALRCVQESLLPGTRLDMVVVDGRSADNAVQVASFECAGFEASVDEREWRVDGFKLHCQRNKTRVG